MSVRPSLSNSRAHVKLSPTSVFEMSPPKAPNHSWFNPDPVLVLIGLAVALVTTAFQLWSVGQDAKRQSARAFREAKAEAATQNLRMVDSEPREKKLIRVDQDIYVAVGYGFANCILVEGKI